MTDVVDHEARALAQAAVNKIASHEELCTNRWQQARDEIKGLRVFMVRFAWALAAAGLGLIAWLAERAFP